MSTWRMSGGCAGNTPRNPPRYAPRSRIASRPISRPISRRFLSRCAGFVGVRLSVSGAASRWEGTISGYLEIEIADEIDGERRSRHGARCGDACVARVPVRVAVIPTPQRSERLLFDTAAYTRAYQTATDMARAALDETVKEAQIERKRERAANKQRARLGFPAHAKGRMTHAATTASDHARKGAPTPPMRRSPAANWVEYTTPRPSAGSSAESPADPLSAMTSPGVEP